MYSNATRFGGYLVTVSGLILFVLLLSDGIRYALAAVAAVLVLLGLTVLHAGLTADRADSLAADRADSPAGDRIGRS